jgi:hypothetical protein
MSEDDSIESDDDHQHSEALMNHDFTEPFKIFEHDALNRSGITHSVVNGNEAVSEPISHHSSVPVFAAALQADSMINHPLSPPSSSSPNRPRIQSRLSQSSSSKSPVHTSSSIAGTLPVPSSETIKSHLLLSPAFVKRLSEIRG